MRILQILPRLAVNTFMFMFITLSAEDVPTQQSDEEGHMKIIIEDRDKYYQTSENKWKYYFKIFDNYYFYELRYISPDQPDSIATTDKSETYNNSGSEGNEEQHCLVHLPNGTDVYTVWVNEQAYTEIFAHFFIHHGTGDLVTKTDYKTRVYLKPQLDIDGYPLDQYGEVVDISNPDHQEIAIEVYSLQFTK